MVSPSSCCTPRINPFDVEGVMVGPSITPETFADVLKSVAVGPANADRFFSETKRGVVLDPFELIGKEERSGWFVDIHR